MCAVSPFLGVGACVKGGGATFLFNQPPSSLHHSLPTHSVQRARCPFETSHLATSAGWVANCQLALPSSPAPSVPLWARERGGEGGWKPSLPCSGLFVCRVVISSNVHSALARLSVWVSRCLLFRLKHPLPQISACLGKIYNPSVSS